MSKQLPLNPSFEQLKKQAKDLLKACQSGDLDACTRVRQFHPRLAAMSNIQTARFTRQDAQLVIAREYGFDSWSLLKHHLENDDRPGRIAEFASDRPKDCANALRSMLTDPDKVAILLIAMGQQTTSHIFKYFEDEEIERIVAAISRHDIVPSDQEDAILEEFEQRLVAGKYVSFGGIDYARGALEKAMGPQKAREVLKRIDAQRKEVLNRLQQLLADHLEDAVPILQNDLQKAEVILSALDEVTTDRIRSHFSASNQSHLPQPTPEPTPKEELNILNEFGRLLIARIYVLRGGVGYARGALEKEMGPGGMADRLLNGATDSSGLLMANHAAPDYLLPTLAKESPKHIALILSKLDAVQAVRIFNSLPEALRKKTEPQLARLCKAVDRPDERIEAIQAIRKLDQRLANHFMSVE